MFFGGKRVAVNGAAFVPDRLGSNTAGKYYPYGEDRGTPIANDQVKFATYTRNSATGLDYADQRYYSNQFGRFMSPDPYQASAGPSDPGRWNRYSYVQGDPVNYTDRTGLNRDAEDCIDDPEACEAEDWGLGGGSGPLNPGGSAPTLPGKVLNEENQLDGLQQAGIINGWGITSTGFELTLTQGEAAGIGICLTDPVCVAIGGGLIAIYATYTFGPDLIQAIENVFQMSRTTSS